MWARGQAGIVDGRTMAAGDESVAELATQQPTTQAEATGAEPAAALALTRQEVVAKMNDLPVFCIVDDHQQFVALRVATGAPAAHGTPAPGGSVTEEAVVFWTEPLEAKSAVVQARGQRPGVTLSLGTMPLGHAFALAEGWAEAEGGGRPFCLRAHSGAVSQLRALLTKQLEHQGMPTTQLFPIYMCEQLTTESIMPIFLSRADLVATWDSACKQAGCDDVPAPSSVTVMDLRILADAMLTEGSDWSSVRFIGTQRAFDLAAEGARAQSDAGGGGKVALFADPEDADEPPSLLPHAPASAGPAVRGRRKTLPNEPCPCGSGRKYKKCCGP